MKAPIAITGGLGYLGGRLCFYLSDSYHVRILTRGGDRALPNWSQDFDVVATDLHDVESLKRAFDGIESVVHLAAMNAGASARNPDQAKRVNVDGTANVMQAADATGVRRVIYMSTAHVYGSPLVGELDEHHPTQNPHPYAETHRSAEDIVRTKKGNVVFRLSNGLGAPRDAFADCWMLIANDLCRQVVETGQITLRGTGFDRRDFIPIADVERAVAHAIQLETDAICDGVFNLASGHSTTTKDLADLIANRALALLGHAPVVQCAPDDGVRAPDFSLSVARLASTGFQVVPDLIPEIDQTLHFCAETFSDA